MVDFEILKLSFTVTKNLKLDIYFVFIILFGIYKIIFIS